MANPLEPAIIFQPIIPTGTNYHNPECEEAAKGYLKKPLLRIRAFISVPISN